MRVVAGMVLVSLASLAAVESATDFWKKYGAIKIGQQCFTVLGRQRWIYRVEEAVASCNNLALSHASPTVSPAQITKDGSAFTTRKMLRLKQKLEYKVQVFRCVMQKVQVTDGNNNINVSSLMAERDSLPISTSLQRGLNKALTACQHFSKCAPVLGGEGSPVPEDVIRTRAFLHCERLMRYHYCFMEDIKPALGIGSFDFAGLDGSFDFLESDAARAEAIIRTNEEVGYDFYGLIE